MTLSGIRFGIHSGDQVGDGMPAGDGIPGAGTDGEVDLAMPGALRTVDSTIDRFM